MLCGHFCYVLLESQKALRSRMDRQSGRMDAGWTVDAQEDGRRMDSGWPTFVRFAIVAADPKKQDGQDGQKIGRMDAG